VLRLEPSNGVTVAVQECSRYPSRVCCVQSACLRLVDAVRVRGDRRIEVTDELLICVAARAILREAAEHPHGDRKWESQQQQARAEPQPTVGYFLLPLWPSPPWLPLLPFPPPWSAGGPPPLSFGGAAGAFLACPGGSPW